MNDELELKNLRVGLELNKVYNENCVETLRKIKDNSIDLVITSPPYNMNLRIRNGEYCSRQIVKEFSTKYEGFDDNMPIDDFYELHSSIIRELLRTSSLIFYNIQIVTGSKRAFFKIIGEFANQLKDIVIWDKRYAQPAMAERVLNRQSELILIFDSTNAISRQFETSYFQRGTLSDVWYIDRGKKVDKSHSAVFPEALVAHILKNFTKEGDVVYDPFMGTGTTAAVCSKLNRYWLGSELSENYVSVINQRISQVSPLGI